MADRTNSPLLLLDREGHIRYSNPAAARLLGWSPFSLAGTSVMNLVHPRDRRRVKSSFAKVVDGQGSDEAAEYRVRGADGSWKTLAIFASNFLDIEPASSIVVSATDVSGWQSQQEILRMLALQDPVTGLVNRRGLRELLEDVVAHRDDVAVAFIDIDHFKRINDSLGHTTGDDVLRAVAGRFAPLVPAEGSICHFGADTFVAVLLGLDADRVVHLVWELVYTLGNPLFVEGRELNLSATAGVALREPASTPDSLLRDADAALTSAKARRRGGVEVFTQEMRTLAIERLAMETDLRHAVEREELSLWLQPVVRLTDGKTEGAEALLRWHRNGRAVDPSVFVPLAEETGLITSLGDWVFGRAMGILLAGITPRLSVNLSPRQLLEPGLPSHVERLMALTGIEPGALVFEVTESVVVENFDVASSSLNSLRRLGCPVGLDDFGTGYSSLAYLRRLPIDFLKLDRRLVQDVDTDPQAARIAETIVSLAGALSLTTIAEGIERGSQASTLKGMGCTFGQGWLFGSPAPPWELGQGSRVSREPGDGSRP